MKKIILLQLTTCFLLLTACGFTPMYGEHKNAAQNLNQIDIAIIPNAEGVILRNALIDKFHTNGYPTTPKYRLNVSDIQQSKSDFDVTIDSEATRRQLTLRTVINLMDVATQKPMLTRDVKVVTSYDVIGSQFTTRVAEEDARKAALNDLARQIETQISLFLSR